MDFKEIIGYSTVLIALISYGIYFKDIFSGKTKPHSFSWFIWGTLTAIAFFGQISNNAGPGAWVTGASVIFCYGISFLGFIKGERNIVTLDWLSLFGAGISLLLWYITKNPLSALLLVLLIDALGFIPTIRKSYRKPQEETIISYFLNGLKFFLALFALQNLSLTTALYPVYLIFANWGFVIMLYLRRKFLKKQHEHV